MRLNEFPRDFYATTVKRGTRWYGVFRVPWRAGPQLVHNCGVVAHFDNELLALRAAAAAMANYFRDNTTGWQSPPNKKHVREIEAVFGKGGK